MTQANDPIVVTGIGAVSPFGTKTADLWDALESGILPAAGEEQTDAPAGHLRVQGWSAEELLGKKGLQYLHNSSKYLLGASLLALQDAGWTESKPDPDTLGIVIGTNMPGVKASMNFDYIALTEGPRYVSPMEAPNTLANSPASHLGIRIQSRACNTTVATGQCAGLDAIGYAANLLRNGRAGTIVVGGVEELNEHVLWQYQSAGVLPQEEAASDAGRPFDAGSTGWLPSEGAGAIVLERKSDAIKRGAPILAELGSWTSAFSARQEREKKVAGLVRSLTNCLKANELDAGGLDFVLSGASGWKEQDAVELLALSGLLEADVPIAAIKGTLGETYGAGGIFQAIAAIGALQRRRLPATRGYRGPQNDLPALAGIQAAAQELAASARLTGLLTAQDMLGSSSALVIRSA